MSDFPNDQTGTVLNRMITRGDDLSKPREIRFFLFVEIEDDAIIVKNSVEEYMKSCSVIIDNINGSCEVIISIIEKPSYELITSLEEAFYGLARTAGGQLTGWECESFYS